MKIINCQQLSDEWYQVRCGIPTASNFDKIVTTKGVPSKQSTKYLYQLAGETITQVKEDTYTNAVMQRGIDMEKEAKSFYKMVNDCDVQEVGFCLDEEKGYGCSPDGLVGDDGAIEIKCPILSTHVSYLLKMNEGIPKEYYQQVQGILLVTGRKWVDFISYYPRIKPVLIRVGRDEDYIRCLQDILGQFCANLEEVVKQLRQGE
jgi:putative phage-type endonuclease